MTDNKKLGTKGERFAAKYLKKHNYKILLRNYKCHFGEIDIIAHNDKYIIFVEVKTRTGLGLMLPRFSVDVKKQLKIRRTADYFLRKYKTDLLMRFDIAEVIVDEYGKMRVEYLKNAFKNAPDIYKK